MKTQDILQKMQEEVQDAPSTDKQGKGNRLQRMVQSEETKRHRSHWNWIINDEETWGMIT